MKTICLYFEIHQANHLKRYRFFDIGTDHYYYDDYENERAITETAQRSYIPALRTMLEMTQTYGKFFRVAFSVSGVVLELMEQYTPEVIDLLHGAFFQRLFGHIARCKRIHGPSDLHDGTDQVPRKEPRRHAAKHR